jgi:5S rRNA maturation endonuclease (ribonuclease M5)
MAMVKYHSENERVKDNIQKILEYFNVDLSSTSKKYYGCCPIHSNSDNNSALLLYKNTGIWMCTTHQCEKIFGRSTLNFVKALISVKKYGWSDSSDKSKMATDLETKELVSKILGQKLDKIEVRTVDRSRVEKLNFIRQVNLLKAQKAISDKETFRKNTIVPSEYYLKRGFSEEILEKYDVGLWTKANSRFFQRTVVPIYDTEYQYIIGYTARSLYQKCLVCGYFHDLNRQCPNKIEENVLSKWEHSTGFKKEFHLYNYWFAKSQLNNKSLIVVEGPSHCWRLAEAGLWNSVAYMGSSISNYQANLIRRLSLEEIVIPSDNDVAGQRIRQQIRSILGTRYKYRDIDLVKNDVAELNTEEIKETFK